MCTTAAARLPAARGREHLVPHTATKVCFCLQSAPSSAFKPQPCKTALNPFRRFCCSISISLVVAIACLSILTPCHQEKSKEVIFFCKTANYVSLQQAKLLHFTGVLLPSTLIRDSCPKQKWFQTIHSHASMLYKTLSAQRSSRS